MTIAPEDVSCSVSRSETRETPIERKPNWIKTRAKMGPEYTELKGLVKREGLHTVCEEAGCPNIYECWEDREATFLIGGDSVHAALRLLPDRVRASRPKLRPGRARVGSRKVRSGHDGPALRDGHRRLPATTSPTSGAWLYSETDPPDPPPQSRGPEWRCSLPTSPARRELLDSRCSDTHVPRCSRTTWRPCRASSSRSGPAFRYERSR